MMIDFQEAKACIDEYCILLANISSMLRPNVAEGELREAIGKLDDSLLPILDAHVKQARILHIMILEKTNARPEQMAVFLYEWSALLVALNKLKLATDRAAEARAEYVRRTVTVVAKGTETVDRSAEAIQAFKRKQGRMRKEEREEYDRKMSPSRPNPVETLNTQNWTETN